MSSSNSHYHTNESVLFSPPPPMRDSSTMQLSFGESSMMLAINNTTASMNDSFQNNTGEVVLGSDLENNPKLSFHRQTDIARSNIVDEDLEGHWMEKQFKKLIFLYRELSSKKLSLSRLEHLDENGHVLDRFRSFNVDENAVEREKTAYKSKKLENRQLEDELDEKTRLLYAKFEQVKFLKQHYEKMFEAFENESSQENEDVPISIMENHPTNQEAEIPTSTSPEQSSQDVETSSQDLKDTLPAGPLVGEATTSSSSQSSSHTPTVMEDDEQELLQSTQPPKTLEEYLGDTRKRLSFSDVVGEEDDGSMVDEEQEQPLLDVDVVKSSSSVDNPILLAVNDFKFLKWSNCIDIIDCREFHSKQVVDVELRIPFLAQGDETKLDVSLTFNKVNKESILLSVQCAQPISSQRIDFSDIIDRAIKQNNVPYLFSAISSRIRSLRK
ncbi:hypothetical protein C9374_007770 [Naegleria lovaniensis]|uniref:Uncharacterized protein n=1 Tax=Naegleria lovaniensis TaxID=51637 RepID=A0AA88GGQ6_NAELO|nr:uncharacterized protein C9374_007770 [Naegleria lovaniensis]KAG2379132.1 hypothetical protein C9374_007770 [Naegleria lovaniensis]